MELSNVSVIKNKKYVRRKKTNEEIPILNVESINIVANGDEPCYLGEILINGIAVRSGISEVRLNLKADKKPNVMIVADRNNIEPSVKKSWGILSTNGFRRHCIGGNTDE